jgi:predicted permease
MIDEIKGDFVQAFRQLRRHRVHTLVVVLILSLGFGANTAVSSLVDAVLLRPLPVEDPKHLVLFQWTSGARPAVQYLTGEWWREATGRLTASSFSHPAFEAFVGEGSGTLAATFAWAELRRAALLVEGEAELVAGQIVSGGYYTGLGVPAILGRPITPEDDREGAEIVGVLGHGYWKRRFGGAPDVVGRTGTLDGRPFTIVGVSVPGFYGTLPIGSLADISVPLRAWRAPGESYLANPAWHWLHVMGRLKPGMTAAQAEAEMAPRLVSGSADGGDPARLRLVDGRQGLTRRRDEERPPLVLLAAVTGLVLLLACATVAGLILARGTARRREIGVRLALGAGRWRIVRQLLTETLALAAIAGAVGVALAAWAKDALAVGLMREVAPAVPLDGRVLAFAGTTALATAILSGLAPALRATRVDLTRDLHEGDHAGAARGLGPALVVAQVALSLVLLVGAGLFLRTLRNLAALETGYAAEGVHLFEVYAPAPGNDLTPRLLERLRALPGVRAVGVSAHPPLSDRTDRARVTLEGRGPASGVDEFAHVRRVGGDFFTATGIPLRAGRALGSPTDANAPKIVVVNEAFARAYFPGEDPLGKRVNGAEVVGVAANTRLGSLRERPPPAVYVPLPPGQGSLSFQVRTTVSSGNLEPLFRGAVREVEPSAAVHDVATLGQRVEAATSGERLLAGLTSFFGALTLVVASLGLYALMAFSTGRRTREIGVRTALGARPADILRMVMGSGLRLVLAGAALGVAGALALTRLASSVLFGVAPSDPATIAAALLLLLGVTLLACWLPARRAAGVDPALALRRE